MSRKRSVAAHRCMLSAAATLMLPAAVRADCPPVTTCTSQKLAENMCGANSASWRQVWTGSDLQSCCNLHWTGCPNWYSQLYNELTNYQGTATEEGLYCSNCSQPCDTCWYYSYPTHSDGGCC